MTPFRPTTGPFYVRTTAFRTTGPFRVRTLVHGCVYLLLATGFVQVWLLDGTAAPYRIFGGSMAETLLGVHRDVVCDDCGFHFICGTDILPVPANAVCPNCGYATNDLQVLRDEKADRVFVDRSAFSIRSPRRWEVVAFRHPQKADNILIKRVVGLPGESIEIHNGDVYVDGHIQRKNLAQQRALAVLVHDANFEPTRKPTPPPRWQAETPDSPLKTHGWHAHACRGHVNPREDMPTTSVGMPPKIGWNSADGRFSHTIGQDGEPIDWLVYHHWQRLAGDCPNFCVSKNGTVPFSVPTTRAVPITDISAYNPWQTRREEDVQPVTDLMLSFRLGPVSGHGTFYIRASDGLSEFETRLQFDVDPPRYQIFCNGQPIVRQAFQPDTEEVRLESLTYGSRLVEVSLIDQQFLLAIDGATIVTWPYDRPESSPTPSPSPLAIGTQALDVTVSDLRVYRDVYYTNPDGGVANSHKGHRVRLQGDEYYVLGDNSPASQDSRVWPGRGAVDGNLLIGKPLLAIPTGSGSLGGAWHFQVPNPMKIRYIR